MVRQSPAVPPECGHRVEQCLRRCDRLLLPEFVRQSRGLNVAERIQKEARTDAWGRTLPARRFRIRECRRKRKAPHHLALIRWLFRHIAYREQGRGGSLRDGWTARTRRGRGADRGRQRWRE